MLALLPLALGFYDELDDYLAGAGSENAALAAFPAQLDQSGLGDWLSHINLKPRSAVDLNHTFAEMDGNSDGAVSFHELTKEMQSWFGVPLIGTRTEALLDTGLHDAHGVHWPLEPITMTNTLFVSVGSSSTQAFCLSVEHGGLTFPQDEAKNQWEVDGSYLGTSVLIHRDTYFPEQKEWKDNANKFATMVQKWATKCVAKHVVFMNSAGYVLRNSITDDIVNELGHRFYALDESLHGTCPADKDYLGFPEKPGKLDKLKGRALQAVAAKIEHVSSWVWPANFKELTPEYSWISSIAGADDKFVWDTGGGSATLKYDRKDFTTLPTSCVMSDIEHTMKKAVALTLKEKKGKYEVVNKDSIVTNQGAGREIKKGAVVIEVNRGAPTAGTIEGVTSIKVSAWPNKAHKSEYSVNDNVVVKVEQILGENVKDAATLAKAQEHIDGKGDNPGEAANFVESVGNIVNKANECFGETKKMVRFFVTGRIREWYHLMPKDDNRYKVAAHWLEKVKAKLKDKLGDTFETDGVEFLAHTDEAKFEGLDALGFSGELAHNLNVVNTLSAGAQKAYSVWTTQ